MLSNQQFSILLLKWDSKYNKRQMPWKGIKDPYKIWLSEIILQQTRVEQGQKYYEAITSKYPTISDLAIAHDEDVYRLWQGLGYYNRCRNMLHTARYINTNYNGMFPIKHKEIIALKGIGDYTAAAIASFAYNLPFAVVDGNVVRILSRVFGDEISFFNAAGKKYFQALAQRVLSIKNPSKHNQAMMDLGATVCKPQQPLCIQCPFGNDCVAYLSDRIDDLPVKKVKLIHKKRFLHFFVFETLTHIYIQKRTANDVWQNLYSFYTIESKDEHLMPPYFIAKKQFLEPIMHLEQTLSHQKINGFFYKITGVNEKELQSMGLIKVDKKAISGFAFPRLIISFFEKNNYL